MLNLNEFAKEIHANACDKGFWDEPRPFDKLCAQTISELAKAFEEAMAGRPMEYRICGETGEPCNRVKDCWHVGCTRDEDMEGRKPEGIAVEMADCAIWILDYLGSVEFDIESFLSVIVAWQGIDVPETFMLAAESIVKAWNGRTQAEINNWLARALKTILAWFEANDLDFEAIARRKHEYNKTRERLHGKLF